MTLFDKQPLTEEEIAERDVCVCGDLRRVHDDHGTGECHNCPCEEFERSAWDEEAGS